MERVSSYSPQDRVSVMYNWDDVRSRGEGGGKPNSTTALLFIDARKGIPLGFTTPNTPAWVPKDAMGYGSHVCEAVCKEGRTVECEGYAIVGIGVINVRCTVLVQHPTFRKFDSGRVRG